jgi:hypothetical protein
MIHVRSEGRTYLESKMDHRESCFPTSSLSDVRGCAIDLGLYVLIFFCATLAILNFLQS